MLKKFTTKLKKASARDLYEISLIGPACKLPLEIMNGKDFFEE